MLHNRCTLISLRAAHGDEQRGGRLVWDDGDEFEGIVQGLNTELCLVEGTMRWVGGDEYRGCFRNGLMHGRGSYFYNDGRIYGGEFVGGMKEGQGKMTYPDGESYRGGWQNDLAHGIGLRTLPDGQKHCGQFEFGRPCGWGMRVYSGGGGFHLGVWKALGTERELLEGKAIYVQADGSRLLEVYKGGKLISSIALARDLAASKNLSPLWQKDSDAANCFICKAHFTLTVRRSHCRNCGQVICSECTKRFRLGEKKKEEKVKKKKS